MASLGHVAVGMVAGRIWTRSAGEKHSGAANEASLIGAMMAFGALSLAPDLDVIAFRLGIPYSAPFGHRGAAHSLFVALALASVAALATRLTLDQIARGQT